MSNLTELLPAFMEGEKIRKKCWGEKQYLFFKDDNIMTNNEVCVSFNGSDFADDWEFYKEPAINWKNIIKKKCLCWFWNSEGSKTINKLQYADENEFYDDCGRTWRYCRPVRKNEVSFYEDVEE